MSVVIKFTFPAGRYHATPWGRHVNEGVVEWPPSPWRLMRAIVGVWKRTCPEFPEAQIKGILSAITQPPRYHLPPHTVAHTRHYMPLGAKSPKEIHGGGTTLVFDTFACVSRLESQALYIGWPEAELSSEDREAFGRLLANLSSLGRAESWVEAELYGGSVDLPLWLATESDLNPVPVFCPDPESVFADTHYPVLDSKKLSQGKVNPTEFLFDCPRWHLCLDTETIHNERWPTVPGAKWINYSRPQSARIAPAQRATRPNPTVARFMLDGPVLPLKTDTVRVAEAVRGALMGRFGNWCAAHPEQAREYRRDDAKAYSSQTFSGKDKLGESLTGHVHAHYLPSGEGDDPRRITHVTVYARNGFAVAEQSAIRALNFLKRREEDSLRVQLVGLGDAKDFTAGVFRTSRVWESTTPFVAHRHLKRSGTRRDTPHLTGPNPNAAFVELTLRELIERAGLPKATITVANPPSSHPRPRDYRRTRSRKNDDGMHRPFGWFKLVFTEPVRGPVCFGFGSHFGLGSFKAVED